MTLYSIIISDLQVIRTKTSSVIFSWWIIPTPDWTQGTHYSSSSRISLLKEIHSTMRFSKCHKCLPCSEQNSASLSLHPLRLYFIFCILVSTSSNCSPMSRAKILKEFEDNYMTIQRLCIFQVKHSFLHSYDISSIYHCIQDGSHNQIYSWHSIISNRETKTNTQICFYQSKNTRVFNWNHMKLQTLNFWHNNDSFT